MPFAADSATMIAAIGLNSSLHPDLSAEGGYGIPFERRRLVNARSTVSFLYADQSNHVG